MMYKLLLVLVLSNGNEDASVIDAKLTRDVCVARMLDMNKAFPSESANIASNREIITSEFMCEGVEIANERYSSSLLTSNNE